jgi:hypothetical protein
VEVLSLVQLIKQCPIVLLGWVHGGQRVLAGGGDAFLLLDLGQGEGCVGLLEKEHELGVGVDEGQLVSL